MNQKKKSSVLTKGYRDDDIDEYDEILDESTVSLTCEYAQHQSPKLIRNFPFIFRNISQRLSKTSLIFEQRSKLKNSKSFKRKLIKFCRKTQRHRLQSSDLKKRSSRRTREFSISLHQRELQQISPISYQLQLQSSSTTSKSQSSTRKNTQKVKNKTCPFNMK